MCDAVWHRARLGALHERSPRYHALALSAQAPFSRMGGSR